MLNKSLFHIDQKNAIQFVTFRTQESVAYYLEKNNINTTKSTSKQQFEQDKFLDNADAGAILNNDIITLLTTLFKSKDTIYYNLIALSIMPNHVHLLFEQIFPLMEIMQKIKGGTALLINKHYHRTGTLWDRGYFDKIVRTEEQLCITYQYIKNNAPNAGLKDADTRFYGIYEDE
ncbi:transposase [Psychromonas antarctica]|uniref:transposase n=1 Tax=Psychromonas antarctica TaxID=67573 RepID=UPI001EE96E31|nr:transposase [Psychromonas antarctica]MCG6202534.1 transposase [Psychromonas antarctica]